MDVKNITVSVPDEVYRAARIRAAERGTSVSAMVASFLQEIPTVPERESLFEVFERIRRANPGFSSRENVPRDELYDRALR